MANASVTPTQSHEIPSLAPLTTVSDISVAAYTSVGRGAVTAHDDVMISDTPEDLIRESLQRDLIAGDWFISTQL